MPALLPKGGKGMGSRQISTVVLAAILTISPLLHAQTATPPEITLPPGDATRGKAIFENNKGNCVSCHRVNGNGSRFGPDLSAIGAPPRGGGGGRGGPPAAAAPPAPARGGGFGGDEVANAAIGRGAPVPPVPSASATETMLRQLAQSILDPNALVSAQNRYVTLTMKDGKKTTGKLFSVDTFAYQILDSNEKLANISKDNVRDATMNSPMPSYKDKLSTQELADVISYLMSLKGQ
jgi:mono/diheme cytochrome c family protein